MNTGGLGKHGEGLAEAFLRRRGYRILDRNCRSRLGELDLVCRDRDTVVFVEVKTRTSDLFAQPSASVGLRKQLKLRQLAEEFLIKHRLEDCPVRFDVLSIVAGPPPRYEHLKEAF